MKLDILQTASARPHACKPLHRNAGREPMSRCNAPRRGSQALMEGCPRCRTPRQTRQERPGRERPGPSLHRTSCV